MKPGTKAAAVGVLVYFALLVLIISVVTVGTKVLFDRPACRARWSDSGLRVRWSLWTDCQVEISPGRWLPAANYRSQP